MQKVNLFLEMPDEKYIEVIKDFEATFFDVSDQVNQVSLQQIHQKINNQNTTESLLMNDLESITKI